MTRIERLSLEPVTVPLHTPFVTAARRTSSLETMVLRLEDGDGRVGWGEGPQSWRVTGESLGGIAACLDGPLRDVLIGAEIGDRDAWTATLHQVHRAVVGNPSARMAADLALHDLAARRDGVPLARWLATAWADGAGSGPPSSPARPLDVATDVTVSAGSSADLASAAAARVDEGFGTIKLKVGTGGDDVRRVLAVREAVGPAISIRVDANQGWTVTEAIATIVAWEDAGAALEFVEQPVARRDRRGLAEVAAAVSTPVMADESVFDLADLDEVAERGQVRLVNLKLAKCGGLGPARALARRADDLGLEVTVGSMMEGPIGIAAAGALALVLGPARVHDLDAAWWAAHPTVLGGPSYAGGRLVLSESPGLGVTGLVASAELP